MSDQITTLINGLFKMSQRNYAANNPADPEVDNRNELKCLSLIDEGWAEDGFDHVDNSQDIITYWKKDEKTKHIHLNFRQQQRFVRELDKLTKEKKNEQKK